MRALLCLTTALLTLGCNGDGAEAGNGSQLVTSGKSEVRLEGLPPEVIEAARKRVPDLKIAEAETETRNSVRYYDLGGSLPDGTEIELDIMQDGASWRVVESQRDIAFASVPPAVATEALASNPKLQPTRVIESRQEDGVVIYELFSKSGSDPVGAKLEVRWDGRQADVLTEEWAH